MIYLQHSLQFVDYNQIANYKSKIDYNYLILTDRNYSDSVLRNKIGKLELAVQCKYMFLYLKRYCCDYDSDHSWDQTSEEVGRCTVHYVQMW